MRVPNAVSLIVFVMILSLIGLAKSETQNMQLVVSKDVERKFNLGLQKGDLVKKISLDGAIKRIISHDFEARKSILESKLPDELTDRENIEKLADYAAIDLVDSAERLLQVHRSGDEIWIFEKNTDSKRSYGILLRRGDQVVHIVILRLLVI